MIIGRLIPAGTGFNAYEEPSAPEIDPNFENAFLDDDMALKDMVLDDRTARAYDREGSLDLFAGGGDSMIGSGKAPRRWRRCYPRCRYNASWRCTGQRSTVIPFPG